METGPLLVIVYWMIFTIRKHFTPKLYSAEKANKYDLNGNDPKARKTAEKKRWAIMAAKWALRVTKWIENALIGIMLIWLAFLIGAVVTGTVVFLGYPI